MAVSIVGTEFTQLTGVSSATVTTPAGAASGDVLLFSLQCFGLNGNIVTITVPSGVEIVLGFFSGDTGAAKTGSAFRTYCLLLTSAPAANYTFSFSRSDVHVDLTCVAITGQSSIPMTPVDPGNLTSMPFVECGRVANTSAAFPSRDVNSKYDTAVRFGDIVTSTDDCLLVAFAMGQHGDIGTPGTLSFSSPSGFTELWTRQRAYTPGSAGEIESRGLTRNLGPAGVSTFTSGSFSPVSNTSVYICWFVFSSATEPEPYADLWYTFPDPFTFPPSVIVDENDPYVYAVGLPPGSGCRIDKIHRETKVIENTVTLAVEFNVFYTCVEQTATHLYIAARRTLAANSDVILKVEKSTLTQVGSVTPTPTHYQIDAMRIGRGWSAGKLWAINRGPFSTANTTLISWDIDTLTEIDNQTIALFTDAWPTRKIEETACLAIDNTGDIYIAGQIPPHTGAGITLRLMKVTSGPTVSVFYDFDTDPSMITTIPRLGNPVANTQTTFFHDSQDDTIVINATDSNSEHEESACSRLVKISPAGSVLYQRDFAAPTTTSQTADLIPFQNFDGTRSLFVGLRSQILFNNCDSSIVQIDVDTLTPISMLRLPATYTHATNPICDPEGQIWVSSEKDIYDAYDGHLHVFGGIPIILDEKIWAYGMVAGYGRGWA